MYSKQYYKIVNGEQVALLRLQLIHPFIVNHYLLFFISSLYQFRYDKQQVAF